MPRPWCASSSSRRCTSALVPTSMPRVGSSTTSSFGPVASHLASTIFCWLPPESVPPSLSRLPALTCRRPAQAPGRAVLRGGAEQARAGEPVADDEGEVAGDRHVDDQALLAAVLGDEAHARLDRGARVPLRQRLAEQRDRCRRRRGRRRTRRGAPRCAPRRRGRRSRRSRPRAPRTTRRRRRRRGSGGRPAAAPRRACRPSSGRAARRRGRPSGSRSRRASRPRSASVET